MGGRKREEEGTDVLYSVEREMRRGKRERKRRKEEFARLLSSPSLFSLSSSCMTEFFSLGDAVKRRTKQGAGAAHSCGMVGGAMCVRSAKEEFERAAGGPPIFFKQEGYEKG